MEEVSFNSDFSSYHISIKYLISSGFKVAKAIFKFNADEFEDIDNYIDLSCYKLALLNQLILLGKATIL